jgi:hypothetical protein
MVTELTEENFVSTLKMEVADSVETLVTAYKM